MEVMVDGRASENAFAATDPKPADLHHHAQKLPVEHGADHDQHHFLANGASERGQQAAEWE